MTRLPNRRSWMATVSALPRQSWRRRPSPAADAGFTLVESLLAMVLFVMVATALAGVLISAVNARGVARHRTVAEQTAIEQVEKVRKYEYDKLGFVSGNPPGTIPVSEASKTVTVSGIKLLVTTAITYVADPTPTSYATSANYKKVVVTVKRASDSKTLTRQVTYVAPPARAPLGGIGNAIVNVQVVDYGSNTPVEGAAVDLATGPSAPRSDATRHHRHGDVPGADAQPGERRNGLLRPLGELLGLRDAQRRRLTGYGGARAGRARTDAEHRDQDLPAGRAHRRGAQGGRVELPGRRDGHRLLVPRVGDVRLQRQRPRPDHARRRADRADARVHGLRAARRADADPGDAVRPGRLPERPHVHDHARGARLRDARGHGDAGRIAGRGRGREHHGRPRRDQHLGHCRLERIHRVRRSRRQRLRRLGDEDWARACRRRGSRRRPD